MRYKTFPDFLGNEQNIRICDITSKMFSRTFATRFVITILPYVTMLYESIWFFRFFSETSGDTKLFDSSEHVLDKICYKILYNDFTIYNVVQSWANILRCKVLVLESSS